MKHSQTAIVSAIAGALALGAAAVSQAVHWPAVEQCAGIVKAGKNDCGSSYNSCGGKVKKDSDPHAWIQLPKGTCDKIVGAKITTDPNNKFGGKGG
jgi:uncharacterized membrane protein